MTDKKNIHISKLFDELGLSGILVRSLFQNFNSTQLLFLKSWFDNEAIDTFHTEAVPSTPSSFTLDLTPAFQISQLQCGWLLCLN